MTRQLQLTKRIKFVKKIRRFQKPGIKHDFVDPIPEVKLDRTPAISAISNRIGLNKNDIRGTFKDLFDAVSKVKPVNSFEQEMLQFKLVGKLSKQDARPALAAPTFNNDIEASIAAIKESIIPPDVIAINDILRECANKSDSERAIRLLGKMSSEFGVKPTDKSREIVAYACVKAEDHDTALKILSSLQTISNLGQFVVWKMIRDNLVKDNSDLAWKLFDGLRSKVLPLPEVCGSMLVNCGKHDLVEKAFKTYRELQAQGLVPNWITHSALIYACSKRKTYYPKAIELFREMESQRMQIDIRVYNNLLQATSKVGDIGTALELWNKLQDTSNSALKVNDITVANLLWTLASAETFADKISKRLYHYDLNPSELKQTANDIIKAAQEQYRITLNAFILNAHLAVMANHNFVQEAELIFDEEFENHHLTRTSSSYEIMLKMYDATRNYEKTTALLEQAKKKNIHLGTEAWRAAIRTAALTKHLPEAIELLRSMVSAGHKPTVDSLRVLHLRLCEEEKWQLRKEMGDLCLPVAIPAPNPYTDWRKRSIGLAELLKKVYGKNAPQLATKLD